MRLIRRCMAVFVVLIFTLVDLLRYIPEGYAKTTLIATESILNSSLIPENMGRVEEVFRGSSGKTIFFIQDAHDSLEAQENIARMITKLVKDRGIKTVFEEGYEGLVPTDNFFGFIKNSKIKQRVSYFLLDKLRLSGAEYAHINRTNDFNLIGVENLRLYGENIEHYKEASKHREEVSKDLKELFTQVSNLANQHFPGNLRVLLKVNGRFSDEKLPLLNYLKELQRFYQKSPLDNRAELFSEKYPSISILLAAETVADPVLTKQLNEMDFKQVFQEILQLEQDISKAHLRDERDREIFTYYQALQLLMKLNQIKLTQPEYEAAQKILKDFKTKELADFVVSLTHRSLVLSKEWERNIKNSILFYDVAQERDKTISRHVGDFFRSENESTAILVFGGFHASGIKEILREHQISYQVISPRINSFSKKHQGYYQHLMAGGQHSFEKPFMSARAARPPSIYFTAAMAGEKNLAQSELRTIANAVETLGVDAESALVELHLEDVKSPPEDTLIDAVIGGPEMRQPILVTHRGGTPIYDRSFAIRISPKWWQSVLFVGVLSFALIGIEKTVGQEAATPHASKQEVLELIQDLSGDYDSNKIAMKRLVEIGDENVAELLVKLWRDRGYIGSKTFDAGEDAAAVLVRIGKPAVGPLVKVLLNDEKWVNRGHAAELLGGIGDTEAVGALIEALNDEHDFVRDSAAGALGKIGDMRAFDSLIKALDDKEDEVRVSSAGSLLLMTMNNNFTELDHLDSEIFVPVLNDWDLDIEEKIAVTSYFILKNDVRVIPRLIGMLDHENPEVWEKAAEHLSSFGAPAAQALIEETKNRRNYYQKQRHDRALEILKKMGATAIEPIMQAYESGKNFPGYEYREILVESGDVRTYDFFIKILTKGEESDVQQYSYITAADAAEALGNIGDRRAVEALIKALSYKSRNDSTASQAAVALGKIGDSTSVEPLIKALTDYKLPAAAVALGKIGDPRAIEPLIKNLSSTDGSVREAARDALIAMSQYGTSERLKFWWSDSPIITFVIGTLIVLSGLYFAIFLAAQFVVVMGYFNIGWAKSILRKGLKWKYDEYSDYFRKHRNGNGSHFFSDLFLKMLNVKNTMRALAFSRDNHAGPILIDWLLRGKDDFRKRAVETLGRLSDPIAQFYHAIYFQKIEAAAAVPGAQEFLQTAFEQKHNKEISRSAALAGAELKLKNFVPFLIDALADADPSYQALAVKGLGKIPAYEAHFYFYLYHKNFKKAALVPHAEKYIEKALTHNNATVRETALWVSRELLVAGKLKSDKVMPGVAESMEDLIMKLNAAASQKRPDDAVLDNKLHRTHKVHFYAMPAEQAQRDALSRFSHNAFGKVGPLLATRQDGAVLPFIGDFFMVDEALQAQDGRVQLRIRKLDDEEIFRRYGLLKLRAPSGEPYEMEWHSLRDVVGRLSMLPGQFGWVERRGHNREIPIGNFSDIFNTIISGDQVHWQPARLEMKGFGTARIRAVHNVFNTATGKPIEVMPTLRSKIPTNLNFALYDSDKKTIITNDFRAFLEMPGALSGTNYQPFFHSPPGLEEVDQSGREKQHAASVSRNGVSMPNHAFYHSTFLDRLNANRTYGVTIRMSKSENDALRLRELLHEYDQFGSQSVLGEWAKDGIVFEKLKKFMYRMGLNVKGMNQSNLYLFPNGDRAEVPTEEHETDHYGEIIRTVYGTQVVGSGVGGLMQAQPAYDMVINNFSMNGDLADLGEYIQGGGTGDFAVQYLLHFLARFLGDLKARGVISADEAHGGESRQLLAAYLEGVSPSIVHDKSYALMPFFPKPEMFELQSQTLPEMSTEYNEDGYSSETATGRYLKNFSVRIADPAVQKIMSAVAGGQTSGSSFKLPGSKVARALQKVFQDFHGDRAVMKTGLEQQYIALAMKFENVWQENWPDLSQRSLIGQFKDLFLGIARAAMEHQFNVELDQQKLDLPEAINQFNKLILDIQRGSADWIGPEAQSDVQGPAASSNRSEVRGQETNTKSSSVGDHKSSEMRVAKVNSLSERRANQVVRSMGMSAQSAVVFVDAEDFEALSESQKQEYLFVTFSNKAVRVVVYNERGQVRDKELNALLKLERVERTDKDLERAAMTFSRMNIPAIHISKHILPAQALVGSLHKKVAFFKASGNKSGTLATAILWAISGGESVNFQGVKNENGFWTVADSLLDELQRVYENNFVFALAA